MISPARNDHYNADYDGETRYANIIGSTIEKSFVPKAISPGGASTLTFTITNPLSTAISAVNFIDNFPLGVEIEGTAVNYTGCGDAGAVPSPAGLTDGDTSLTFTGIGIAGFDTCTIEVTVTSATPGIYDNETENLKIGEFDTLSKASDTLVVSSFHHRLPAVLVWRLSWRAGPFLARLSRRNRKLR